MWGARHVCNTNCSAFRGQTGGPVCEGSKPSYMKPTKATAQRVRYQPPARDDNFNPKRVQHRHLWVLAFFSFLLFRLWNLWPAQNNKKTCTCNDECSPVYLAVYYKHFFWQSLVAFFLATMMVLSFKLWITTSIELYTFIPLPEKC